MSTWWTTCTYAGRMSDENIGATFDQEELRSWAALATLLEWLPAALDSQLQAESELSHFEFGVLYALAEAPEFTLRMSTLAGYSNSSLSRLSRAASRLEARGWLGRAPDPGDGRYTLATLTETGREKVGQATPGHVELVRRVVFKSLSKAQTKQLRDISDKIMEAIRADGAWRPS